MTSRRDRPSTSRRSDGFSSDEVNNDKLVHSVETKASKWLLTIATKWKGIMGGPCIMKKGVTPYLGKREIVLKFVLPFSNPSYLPFVFSRH